VNTSTIPLANIGATASATGPNTGAGVTGNGNQQSNLSGKLPIDVSRPVSSTASGAPSTGFGVIAAGVGLGNGAIWNTTTTLLSQANNLATLSPEGNDHGHTGQNTIAGYHPGGFKR
jgi:hypothetical protein